jgi:hypothetical protein
METTMLTLTNAEAVDLLDVVTEPEAAIEIGAVQFNKLVKLYLLLSDKENHQGLMLTPVDLIENETDKMFDFVSDNAGCPTGNCPVLLPPQLEQMG